MFYYISCAPCTKVLDQRRKKQTAARAKAEKAARKAAQAQLVEDGNAVEPEYDHPLPSSTNPFWEEEMRLGPGPPPKRRNRQGVGDMHGKEKDRASKEKSRRKSGSMEIAQTATTGAATPSNGEGPGGASSNQNMTLNAGTTADAAHPIAIEISQDPPDTNWNRRRYQREDELLWGLDGDDHNPPPTTASGAPLSRNSSSDRRRQGSYYYARNPAVNDLHPPVVSTAPKSRLETQWMLQPPPRAKIMEGKERASRERSVTGSTQSSRASSRRTGPNSIRAGETKLKRAGNVASGNDQLLGVASIGKSRSRGSSNGSLASSRAQSRTPSAQRGDVVAPSPDSLQPTRTTSQRKAPPPSSLETVPSLMLPSSPFPQTARPGLQTIPSTSLVHSSKNEKENSVYEPLPLSSATDGADPITASSNVLQPASDQINRAGSLNHRKRSTEAVAAAKVLGKQDDMNRHEGWQFPGAEDGWGFPVISGNQRGSGE